MKKIFCGLALLVLAGCGSYPIATWEKAPLHRALSVADNNGTGGAWAVGFATNETGKPISPKISDKLTSVFIPTTPNPTSGFLILVPKKDLIFLNMNFEDAMKFIISVGAVGELK
jgi:uncharacterized membrane protein